MASPVQGPNAADAPQRLSRYRSTRNSHAQRAVTNIASNEPPPVPPYTTLGVNHTNATQHVLPPQGKSPNAAALAMLVIPNDASVSHDDPITRSQSIQRSRSRYRKNPKSTAATVSSTLVPPLPPPQQVPPDPTGVQRADTIPQFSKEQKRVRLVTRERTTGEPGLAEDNELTNAPRSAEERIALARAQLPRGGSTPVLLSRSAPQQPNGTSQPQSTDAAVPLQTSRSRYRRPVIMKQQSATDLRATTQATDLENTLPPTSKEEPREAMRRIQKPAPSGGPSSTELRSLPRSLTKSLLDQVPDANKNDNQNYISHLKAITRQNTLDSQKQLLLPTAARAHASRAQNEVKKLMDAEAERQRRMQEKIRLEREKVRAEEEAQINAKREEKERNVTEKREREEKEREEKTAAIAVVRERKELEKAERRKKIPLADQLLPKRHQRKESREEGVDRHRDRSLSALEGGESTKQTSAEDVQEKSVPAVPKEHLEFFKKRRGDDEPSSNRAGELSKQRDQRTDDTINIKPGGGGVVPGVDAPLSAINAGERRVLVECNRSSILLPVTSTTTTADLIRSATTCSTESIDADTSVLLESFGKIGIQRPLRKHEHIRDIMNSWDDDRQNSLILMPSATGGADADLDSRSVAARQPEEVSFQLHYSQRPGKWDKRFVTLRSDGQIVSSKSQGHKDITNVCHMSDFDIYTPDKQQLTQTIRPPKKICFAIKSQQKSNMFLSTENFVHFFCTGDKQVAAEWYKAVQGWRSWYLVNIMGEGTKSQDMLSTQQKRPTSQDSHYQLGSFKPLLDFDTFAFTTDKISDGGHMGGVELLSHARNKVSKSGPAHIRDAGKSHLPGSTEDGTFAPTGLLGRSYSARQKVNNNREQALAAEGPFTGGLLDAQLRPSMDQGRPRVRMGPPMLNMKMPSNFADGSLLRKVEAEEGPRLPAIERAKGEEIVVGTGEGL